MTFANAVRNQEGRTENGMKARQSTANACVDLFYKIGASRGKDIVPAFVAAFAENEELALRIALWARDVRGGAGERRIFRDILSYLEKTDTTAAKALLNKAPLVGRWDDVFTVTNPELQTVAFDMVKQAIKDKNGLAAKWTPRKGLVAVNFRKHMAMTPKTYRKTLVTLSKTVEQNMCAKQWDTIDYSHVPSVASAKLRKAFYRNDEQRYKAYVEALVGNKKFEGRDVKVNASAIYPYDVIKPLWSGTEDKTGLDFVVKQWEVLPNYVGNNKVLAMVDVSGSMMTSVGKNTKVTCLEVAVSLGLYTADKNTGPFKDTFLTFSGTPELLYLQGNIAQKMLQMNNSNWGMNTNVIAAFKKILQTAKAGEVSQEDMPTTLMIMSDMQFDMCAKFDDSALESVRRQYSEAGYTMPNIVFWNLRSSDNVPVKSNEQGVALVSGFSPAIMKAVLEADTEEFSPLGIMMKAVQQDKYDPAG